MSTRRSLVLAILMLGVGAPAPAAADWRRIDSPNFVVIGDVSARTLRDVAMEFEGFRETLTRVMTERATSTPVPTVVIVFPSDRAFTPFKPLYQGKPIASAGFFIGRQDTNYIAVVTEGDTDRLRIVFHEYAHLVISNVLRNVPVWLNEGLAEFYCTYELRGAREAVLGKVIPHHLLRLQETRLLKLDELLSVNRDSPLYNEKDRRSVFYAQSWALTHWILRSQPDKTKALFTYLDRVSAGALPTDAWKEAFGATNVERELEDYVRRRVYQAVLYTFSEKLVRFEGTATPLPAADAEAFLAELLLQMGRLDEAASRLSEAAKRDPENERVRTVSALLEIARGEHEKANAQLLSIGNPTDWLIAYSAAAAIAEIVERGSGSPEANQLDAARRLFGLSQQRGELANALARLSLLELRSSAGPTKETRAAIERARLMATGREDYAFMHAQVLAKLSEFAEARKVVGPLLSPLYPAGIRDSARSLMGYIARLENLAKLRAEGSVQNAPDNLTAAQPFTPPDTDLKPAPPDTDLRPADPTTPSSTPFRAGYRKVEAGEHRLEGALEQIECGTADNAVFHVRTAEGTTRLPGRMKNVEFIAYRSDLPSHIGCGPFKALRVYVTWRESSTGKLVVAVEFPPE